MVRKGDFDAAVPLPPGMELAAIRKAVDYIEKQLADFADLYDEQRNVFSAIVGIFGTKALDQFSSYEKHRHADHAQQRFPDLCRRGCAAQGNPQFCLESKGSKRPWAVQSHYDHPGWYIIWRYLVDRTESIERARPIVVWRVDVAFLEKSDWKYEKSTAGDAGGGRTHTFGVKSPALKLKGKAAYLRKDVVIRDGKPIARNGDEEHGSDG